jgi:hypothetical protein
MQPLHVARTGYYLDIFLKITKWSQNILFSARNLVTHVLDLLHSFLFMALLFVCVCVCVCLCGVIKGALARFST